MPPSHPLFPLKKRNNNNKTMFFCIPNNKMHTYKHNVKLRNVVYIISIDNIKQTLTMTIVDETS
jgi:hypothetical protein